MASIKELLESGYITGSIAPCGYIYINPKRNHNKRKDVPLLKLDPIKSEIVKEVFHLFAHENKLWAEIIAIIAKKYPNNSIPHSSLRTIVKNSFYCGYMRHNGKKYKHVYPTIIDEETFNKAQQRISYLSQLSLKEKRALYSKNKNKTNPLRPWQKFALESGKYPFRPNYGYFSEKKSGILQELHLDDKKAKIIKEIFTSYIAKPLSIRTLVTHINDKFEMNISNAFISNVLQNKFYYGIIELNGKEYPHIYPTIISKEIFDAAQDKIAKNKCNNPYIPTIHVDTMKRTLETFLTIPNGQFSLEDLIATNPQSPVEIRKELMRLWKTKALREVAINIWEITE